MQNDIRAEAAQYYDTNPALPDDIAFYSVLWGGTGARGAVW